MRIPLRSRIARRLFSLLPYSGLIPPPARPQGVSAILRVWNEKDWLEASINSVKDCVDEIVAVDNGSTDGSLELLGKLAGKIEKLRVFSFAGKAPWDFSNFALEKTRYRWVMKWDADFVSFAGPWGNLGGLTQYLRALDQRVYYYINPRLIELTGDFGHQFPGMRVRGDMEVFTYSEAARYVPVERSYSRSPYPVELPAGYEPNPFVLRMEGVKLPLYYRILSFDRTVAYHVNVKPGLRHLLGYFYLQWLGSVNYLKKQPFEEYAKEQIAARWKLGELSSAADFYMSEYARRLSPYDESLGELPENIKALAAGSRFKVTYKDGKPAGRAE